MDEDQSSGEENRGMWNVDMEENAEGLLDWEENKWTYTGRDRTRDIEAKSGKTENDVLWSCDARGRSGKGDDAGVRGGKTRKSTTKIEMDGGDTWDDDESSGAERGDERSEHMEKVDYDGR